MRTSDHSSLHNILLTTQESGPEFTQTLRHYLQERLPEYMIPSFFILLEDLPVTSSGKIDYQALPPPDQSLLDSGSSLVAPRTSLERSLADIWMNVLGLHQVSIEDNFFRIGGHSLLVTRVIARLRDILHIELPLRIFFENPTITALAEYIETFGFMIQEAPLSRDGDRSGREEGEI
jgi:acyl carrier protein